MAILGAFFMFALSGYTYIGCICFLLSLLILVYGYLSRKKKKGPAVALSAFIALGLCVFAVFEIPIIAACGGDENPEADYLIVLGARVMGESPSRSLVNRLEAALDYARDYPESMIIVSGGQGEGEKVSEAAAMETYLLQRGVAPSRIIREDNSTSTLENLTFSFEIIRSRGDDPADGVAIVSSEYHLHRANMVAESLGADPLTVAAETDLKLMMVNYFIREGLASVYMFVFGF